MCIKTVLVFTLLLIIVLKVINDTNHHNILFHFVTVIHSM